MFLSAVSLTVVLATTPQTRTLSTAESDVNRATRSSVLTLMSGGEERGVAVCIDASGYFVAHQNVLRFPILVGRTRNGTSVQLNVCAKDSTTNLALLKAEGAVNQPFTAISVAEDDGSARDYAFALIPGQVIKTEIVSSDKLGLVQSTRRAIPLLELRFQASLSRVGGAPVFTQKGKLLGFLNATLPTDEGNRIASQQAMKASSPKMGLNNAETYGPTGLTVGYAVGPAALQRVVEGFRSPSHTVTFPAIGILIADAKQSGAEVKTIAPGSAAEEAGLKVGDVIIELGGRAIRSQIDYAKLMMRFKPGEPIDLKIRRGEETLTLRVTPRS